MSAMDEEFPCVTKLKETIHYLGKSVEGVAGDFGISARNMYNYVNGKVVVPEELRPKFAAYLQCKQEFLFPHPSFWLPGVVKEDQPGQRVQEEESVKRRNFIALGAGAMALPAIGLDMRLGLAHPGKLDAQAAVSLEAIGNRLRDEEVLAICKTEIPIWWRLYYEGQHTKIKQVLSGYLLRLSTIAERPSRSQQLAGNLASQAHQLAYLLALQKQDFCIALMHTKQAFQYGVIAEDFNLQTSSLIREGYIYYCVNDPESMLYVYQKAFQYCEKIAPLLQGGTYSGLAKAHAFLQQEQEADHFLGLTRDTFPEHPEKDPTYSYTHWDNFTPANYEVVTYLQLNQAKNARQACEKAAHTGTLRTPFRVELLIRQAETSFALGKMKECCSYVEQAVIAAWELGSDLRYKEAYNVYCLMRKKWPREKDVQDLAFLFPHRERT